ncbi:MAG: toll/interleukin-1 receptor domain-containing protein [Pyrinomonadaceae bacterium]
MPVAEKTKPLIFISHSAKEQMAKEVLYQLYKGLRRNFDVLLDREKLRPGANWRWELHTWMGLCNGAVVLLSEDALYRSPWVKREATILGYRREDETDFILVPVLLPPVTPDLLRQSEEFKPLALDAIQAAKGDSPDQIAQQVLDALAPLRQGSGRKTTLQQVEEIVASILFTQVEFGRPNAKQLFDTAAKELGKRMIWQSRRPYSEQFARYLLSAELEKSTKALVYLTRFFNNKDAVFRLLNNYLQPFWVNPDAIPELARINKRPRGQRAVCVNGAEYPFTSESYVLRASGVIRKWIYAQITQKNGYEEVSPAAQALLEQEVISQIAPKVGFLAGEDYSVAQVEDTLYQREEEEPFFILIPKEHNEQLIEWLRTRFQPFTFFFLHGEQVPDAQTLAGKQVVLLTPELTAGLETKVRQLLRRAQSDITQTP